MISGFNTDIEHQGTVYHVQTEDKGAPARVIMSLVYEGGTILASKRASYEDLGSTDLDRKHLAERLSRQHKLICAALKAGRINELKEMTARKVAESLKAPAVTAAETALPVHPTISVPVTTMETAPAEVAVTAAETALPVHPAISVPVTMMETPTAQKSDPAVPRGPLRIAIVEPDNVFEVLPAFDEELVLEGIQIIEDEDLDILPAEAIAAVSELSGRERTVNSKLSLELLGDAKFKGGDRSSVNIMLCRGTERKVVADAQIMIKVLGSTFRPVIFHAKSDANGIARVHLQLPHFQAGRAALLIRAMADGQEVELRRAVSPG